MSSNIAELRQKAKLPAKQAGGSTVAEFFTANRQSIAAVLPKHVSPDRMLKIALGAMRSTPKLMECTTESLFGAVVQCAQLGLEPNTPMGHAYLIPFKNSRANRTDVQVIIGYRGLIDLSRRSGQIVSIAAHAVYELDEFEWEYGLDEKLSHRPAQGDRGSITHFYAVAKLKDGGHAFEVMGITDVEKIRNASQNHKTAKRFGKQSVWDQHFEEMGRKTTIRRLFKYLPVSIELATATALDSAAEDGRAQQFEDVLEGSFAVVEDGYQNDDEPPQQAAEWPKKQIDEQTGEEHWIDSRGIRHNPQVHGMGANGVPSTTRDDHFTKRRSVDPRTHADYEQQALDVLNGQGEAQAQAQAPEQQSTPGWTKEQVAKAIETSTTVDELDEAESLVSDAGLDDATAQDLYAMAAEKRTELTDVEFA